MAMMNSWHHNVFIWNFTALVTLYKITVLSWSGSEYANLFGKSCTVLIVAEQHCDIIFQCDTYMYKYENISGVLVLCTYLFSKVECFCKI